MITFATENFPSFEFILLNKMILQLLFDTSKLIGYLTFETTPNEKK